MKLIITRGLPGSGKSTWAESYVLERPPGDVVRVNRDLLRVMLHSDRFGGQQTESLVEQVRDLIIEAALPKCKAVISDDTNLSSRAIGRLQGVAARLGFEIHIEDFTHVAPEVCIERDSKRPQPVGEKVIRDMYERFMGQG